ncbi:hypothetical protein TSUD_406020 [Trifolium subterraneum]|uniref:Aminotransferase-like plant mobile domain-containing protein n=1 Tax=Trifolium subterraneum TaxID=3900 RepID=A0A2Z6P2F5_TRISU|nr:hypothetical protein TSUD_406020 [Trifolium subterraneum]
MVSSHGWIFACSFAFSLSGTLGIVLPQPHGGCQNVLGPVIASGLESLVRSNFNVLDFGVLWAFAERWHPETSTFHLLIGEMGITLDDVQCLLHLPIEGKFLNHRKMTIPEGAQMVSSFLGIDEEDALDINKSSYYLDVVYLQYFQDLSSVHEWNWGSTALVHLQNYLDYASQVGSSQMVGYMSLLEGTLRRILNMLNLCLTYKRLSRGRRGGRRAQALLIF